MKSKAKRLTANDPAQQATGKITFPPLPGPGPSNTVSIRLSEAMVARLRLHAAASGRTIAKQADLILRAWYEMYDGREVL